MGHAAGIVFNMSFHVLTSFCCRTVNSDNFTATYCHKFLRKAVSWVRYYKYLLFLVSLKYQTWTIYCRYKNSVWLRCWSYREYQLPPQPLIRFSLKVPFKVDIQKDLRYYAKQGSSVIFVFRGNVCSRMSWWRHKHNNTDDGTRGPYSLAMVSVTWHLILSSCVMIYQINPCRSCNVITFRVVVVQ